MLLIIIDVIQRVEILSAESTTRRKSVAKLRQNTGSAKQMLKKV